MTTRGARLIELGAVPGGPSQVVPDAARLGDWQVVVDGLVGESAVRTLLADLHRVGPGALLPPPAAAAVVALHRSGRWWVVRDALGTRPLHWARGAAGGVVVGSDGGEVARRAGVALAPDEAHVAEVLAGGPWSTTSTPIAALHRLAPGHLLRGSTTGAVHVERWWRPSGVGHPSVPRRGPLDEHDLAATIAATVSEAVAAAARHDDAAPLAVELSGGLDSSLLAALAVTEAEHQGRPAPVAVTLFGPDDAARDRPWAAAVARALRLVHVEVPWQPRTPADVEAEGGGPTRLADPPNAFGAVARAAAAGGARVVLSGAGGDQLLAGSPVAAWEFAGRGPVALHRALGSTWPSAMADRATARAVLASAAPAPVRRRLAHRRLRRWPWVQTGLADRVALADRVTDARRPITHPADAARTALVSGGWEVHAREVAAAVAARSGIDVAAPFADRRVVEAALRLPESARWHRGDDRALSRRLLPPSVPPHVRDRRDKGEFSSLFRRELHTLDPGDPRRWVSVARGWVDPGPAAVCLEAARASGRGVWPAWALVSVELWARTLDGTVAPVVTVGPTVP